MTDHLAGKTVLVVGGSVGMGRGIVRAIARQGGNVVVADRDDVGGAECVEQVVVAGGAASFVHCDVTDEEHIARAVDTALERHGRLDAAVNNAAIEGPKINTMDYPDDDWHRVLHINLTAVWQCMRHQIRAMLANPGGSIVNVASTAGLTGLPGRAAYNAAKHGVIGLTKTAAIEFGRVGIRVNAVAPGYMRTPMSVRIMGDRLDEIGREASLLGRIAEIDEMGEPVAFLCGDGASWITGAALPVDGGFLSHGWFTRPTGSDGILYPSE
ncbi:SDR family oxidoreductase [Microbacterium sp. LWH7-1.2]|uniref:SDR family NAD(P)-dependent oxidoreductase n=1 Tax=Microbacterium sp. LWH7-1.2 TaxID=3135257 RepID=UPI003139D260